MQDLKLLWEGFKPAAITGMTCWGLFSSPPGTDGHRAEPAFSWGCLDPLSYLPAGVCSALSAQAIQHIYILPWKVYKYLCQLSQLPTSPCKLLFACSQLQPVALSIWQTWAFTTLHLLLPPTFQLILKALSTYHLLHPTFPFWGVFSLKIVTSARDSCENDSWDVCKNDD